jgi:tRNA G26 N,N-dimethylase Trm1
MRYTFISAQYANPEQTAAIAITEEAAAVALSEADTPFHWADLLAWGTPEPYAVPVDSNITAVPDTLFGGPSIREALSGQS